MVTHVNEARTGPAAHRVGVRVPATRMPVRRPGPTPGPRVRALVGGGTGRSRRRTHRGSGVAGWPFAAARASLGA